VVGSIGERGLLKHAADNPAIMGADIVDVMEPPFPRVAAPTRCARRSSS
jgi:cystathionine beta-synthase